MGNIGSWNSQMPSNESSIMDGDDLLRSHWSILNAAWAEEHFFSASSTGVHALGSARPFYGLRSAVSVRPDVARLMLTSDNTQLWSVSSNLSQLLTARPQHLLESFQTATANCIWAESNVTQVGLGSGNVPFGLSYGALPFVQVSVQTSEHTILHPVILAISVSSVSCIAYDTTGVDRTGTTLFHVRSIGTILAP